MLGYPCSSFTFYFKHGSMKFDPHAHISLFKQLYTNACWEIDTDFSLAPLRFLFRLCTEKSKFILIDITRYAQSSCFYNLKITCFCSLKMKGLTNKYPLRQTEILRFFYRKIQV